MGLIPLPLHIWDGGHQILQEIKLLLQFNALLPEGGGASAGHAPFVPGHAPWAEAPPLFVVLFFCCEPLGGGGTHLGVGPISGLLQPLPV